MRKRILFLALAAPMIPALHFLVTGSGDSFCAAIILGAIALALWADYELHLKNEEMEYYIREWGLEEARKSREECELLVTRTAIRRELVKQWME